MWLHQEWPHSQFPTTARRICALTLQLSSASAWTARMGPPDWEVFLYHLSNSKWDVRLAGDSCDDAGNIIEHIYCFAAKANDFSIVGSKNQFVSEWSRYDSKEAERHWEVQCIVSFLFDCIHYKTVTMGSHIPVLKFIWYSKLFQVLRVCGPL